MHVRAVGGSGGGGRLRNKESVHVVVSPQRPPSPSPSIRTGFCLFMAKTNGTSAASLKYSHIIAHGGEVDSFIFLFWVQQR